MNNIFIGNDINLRYIAEHKRAFNIGNLYPLEIFESLVATQKNATIECSCKIFQDILYPARFNIWLLPAQAYKQNQVNTVLQLFKQIEARIDVKLNYQLFQQFYDHRFDISKVKQVITGVDLRNDLAASRVKIWFILEEYPEKVETAIALHGDIPDLRTLLIQSELLIGFDFGFDGSTAIKIYPAINSENLKRAEVQQRLQQVLSPPALQLLKLCSGIHISFDHKTQDKILHYCLTELNYLDNLIYKLRNDLANKINFHYQNKQLNRVFVSLKETELITGLVENINIYYMMDNHLMRPD